MKLSTLAIILSVATALGSPHAAAKDVTNEPQFDTERLIYGNDVDSLLNVTDIDQVKKSHAAGLARVKGQLIHLRRELLKENLNPINQTTIAIIDNIQLEISQGLSRIQSPYYDVRALLQSQMEITSNPECRISRDMYRGVLSVNNVCPNDTITYRLESDGSEWYLTGLKSNTLHKTFKVMDDIVKKGTSQ